MLENALTHGTDLRSADRPGNGLVEHFDLAAVSTPDQIVDLLSIVGAAVGHGQQDALDFQLGVDLPPDFLHSLQKLFQTLCRQILRLHGNQGGVCCCQCIDGQHPKGRGAIQQNEIVVVLCTLQHLFEHLFPVHAVDKGNFQPCKFDVCWNQVNALCMVQDAFTGRNALVIHGFCHQGGKGSGQFIGLLQPMLMVKLPCGSASTSRTFLPSAASPTPKFSQVVVLPVPPFWLTMAIVVAFFEIFITSASLSRGWFGSGRKAASWWVRYTEKRAGIVSCFGSGCCFLQGTSAQSGYGQRSAS